jgi:hypothetical protein
MCSRTVKRGDEYEWHHVSIEGDLVFGFAVLDFLGGSIDVEFVVLPSRVRIG